MLALAPLHLSFTAPATAFRSGTPSMLASKGFCGGLPGAISPLGEFDPLGFSENVDVSRESR
jgi:hypothetical protein